MVLNEIALSNRDVTFFSIAAAETANTFCANSFEIQHKFLNLCCIIQNNTVANYSQRNKKKGLYEMRKRHVVMPRLIPH